MSNPINLFNQWWQIALADSPLKQKSAVCVSTVNPNGFPEGRFVDLKDVNDDGFVFCSYFDSNKGRHLADNPKIALTIWWDHVGYQVRVVGKATTLADDKAQEYWQARSRQAQLTTTCFEQSQPMQSEAELSLRVKHARHQFEGQEIPKPANWGGYLVEPQSIEFLTFKESRLHFREQFVKQGNNWTSGFLQP